MISTTALIKSIQKKPGAIYPMPFWMSLIYFGIPTALGWICIYIGIPALIKAGVPLFWNFWLCLSIPFIPMFGASLIAYRLEGNVWTWASFKTRFRLKPVPRRDWLWILVLIAWIGGYIVLRQTLSR